MATHHGKEGVVTLVVQLLVMQLDLQLDTTHDVVEDTALEDSMKSFLVGRGTFTASIDMNYDETNTGQTLTQGASLSFVFLPEGNESGDRKLFWHWNCYWYVCRCSIRWCNN